MTQAAADLHAAETVSAHWGGLATPPRLVHMRENTVFDVTLRTGLRAALRLHRRGYQSAARLRSELRWTEALADAAFPCPWPQRTQAGELFATAPDGRLASVVQWIDGRSLAAAAPGRDTPLHALGGLIADLHLTSDAVAPGDLDRPTWDAAAFCDPDRPRWGRFWENPTLSPPERARLQDVRADLALRLAGLRPEPAGLIHADLLPDNVLVAGPDLFLIDFDDGGFGDRRYDLATALIQDFERADFEARASALIAGYAAAGGPVAVTPGEILVFAACRAVASCGWTTTRLPEGDPRHRAYAVRALTAVDRLTEMS